MTVDMRRIGFLGPQGTFTEEALLTQPDLANQELVPMRTFVDILAATQAGELDLGFVAIENAIEGTVNVTLDTLAFDTDLLIQREVVLDIEMNLMAKPGTKLSDIKLISSHPIANAQCRNFLRRELNNIDIAPANSTAEAAEAASLNDGMAALGTKLAGERYGLEVIESNVADHPGNQTRFLLVGSNDVPHQTRHDKTTVVITQREDKPGSLVQILEEFAARSLNLSKLVSRPVKTNLGQYCFIVDVDGHIADDVTADCLRAVRAKHADVKFLGSYPAAGKGSTEVRTAADAAWTEATEWMLTLRQKIR